MINLACPDWRHSSALIGCLNEGSMLTVAKKGVGKPTSGPLNATGGNVLFNGHIYGITLSYVMVGFAF